MRSTEQRTRTPVMADVARLAGVSHQTVSRVINDHPSVTPVTRERVQRAIAELGYRRNRAARMLVTRRSSTLGVISVNGSHYGPASTLFGIEEAARAVGFFVNFVSLQQVDRTVMREALDHLLGADVEGLVVIATSRQAVDAVRGLSPDVPLVVLQGSVEDGLAAVVIDQVQGARAATRHLLDLGHRTVHHVRGPEDWLEAEARVGGWQSELRERGAVVPQALLGDWSPASGYAAGKRLARDPDVTAVFVANDQMSFGVMRALHEEGVAVPADVSVVGFDDTPESAYAIPPLTTVRQDFSEIGKRCVRHLLALVRDEPGEVDLVITPELVVRDSSAAPRPRDEGPVGGPTTGTGQGGALTRRQPGRTEKRNAVAEA